MTVALSVPKTLRTCKDAELSAQFENAVRTGVLTGNCSQTYTVSLYDNDAELSGYHLKAFFEAVLYILSGMVSLGIVPVVYALHQNNKEKARAEKIHGLIDELVKPDEVMPSEWDINDSKIQGMRIAPGSATGLPKNPSPLEKNIIEIYHDLSNITQPEAANIPTINQLSVFGDGHGNVKLVLNTLINTGYLKIKNKLQFEKLITLIDNVGAYDVKMLESFEQALGPGKNGDKELLPLGDLFADRIGNDFHMLTLFYFLDKINISYTIPHSNHTNELIAYYLLNKDKDIDSKYQSLEDGLKQLKGKFAKIHDEQSNSLFGLHYLLGQKTDVQSPIYRKQFKKMFEVYSKHEQLFISKDIDVNKEKHVFFCHAPIGKKSFDDLYNISRSENSADFPEACKLAMPDYVMPAESITHADKTLQQALEIKEGSREYALSRLTRTAVSQTFPERLKIINEWVQNNVCSSFEIFAHFMLNRGNLRCKNGERIENPFFASAWNRGNFARNEHKDRTHPKYQTDHELPDPSVALVVHGHTAKIPAAGFVSLDGICGKRKLNDDGDRKIFVA